MRRLAYRSPWNSGLHRLFCTLGGNQTYYKVLGVARQASVKEVKAKYKELVKKYHPDVYTGTDKEIYKRIQEAYKTLVSPKKRMEYDEKLDKQSGRPSSESGKPQGAESGQDWSNIDDEYKAKTNTKDFYKDFNKVRTDQTIDEAQEYKTFFNKKVVTDFEKVNVRVDDSLLNMSEKDWERAKFIDKRNEKNPVKGYVDEQGTGFSNTLEETIEVANENTGEKRKLRVLALMARRGLSYGAAKIVILVSGITLVFIFGLGHEIREAQKRVAKIAEEQYKEMERQDRGQQLKSKMVFD